jgi:hypothetical protein
MAEAASSALRATAYEPSTATAPTARATPSHCLSRFGYLFGIGIPAGFLPSARELGPADLT